MEIQAIPSLKKLLPLVWNRLNSMEIKDSNGTGVGSVTGLK